MIFKSVYQQIGNTPLVRVQLDTPGTILAKLEYLNPGGSIKDRSALYLIEKAEQDGILQPGGTIVDASSGNHGIATAMIGAAKGYNVIMVVPEKTSKEKCDALTAYGAQIVRCPATDNVLDPDGYYYKARSIHESIPGSFMPNQYFNPTNAEAHYHSLAPEIWNQTEGTVTHVFAAAGTGGHCTGIARYLKEKNPDAKVIALDSNMSWRATKGNPRPYKVEGMGLDFKSPVFDESIIDEILEVNDEEAFASLKDLAHRHGILAGPSSGAVTAGLLKYAPRLSEKDVVVLIFGDSGRAYLTKKFFEKEYPYPDKMPRTGEMEVI